MEFVKYQHIERLGTIETEGIENGMCYIFPKIDGTNGQIWFSQKDNKIHSGSRSRELSIDNDNQGFFEWVLKQNNIFSFLIHNSTTRLFGEWLIPHTLKTYEETAWRKFYVFDVMRDDEYLVYESYKELLDEFNIDYIPPICKVQYPSQERLTNQLEKNGYLIKDGEGSGEGIVIKNYAYKNRFDRVTWGKIVKNEFKEKHVKTQGVAELIENKIIEMEIVNKYVTLSLIDKEFSKIENDGGWQSKSIPRLLSTIFYCLITEETWHFIKEFKNPIIDFKKLHMFTVNKIKELKSELF